MKPAYRYLIFTFVAICLSAIVAVFIVGYTSKNFETFAVAEKNTVAWLWSLLLIAVICRRTAFFRKKDKVGQ